MRANVCPHSAIILALTAESTMNKGIERKYEGMRAKMKKNFYGRITKASLVGAEFSTDVFMTEPFLVER